MGWSMAVQEFQAAQPQLEVERLLSGRLSDRGPLPAAREGDHDTVVVNVESPDAIAQVVEVIAEAERTRRSVLADEFQRPLIAARRVHDALERLRSLTTLEDLERAVPGELC